MIWSGVPNIRFSDSICGSYSARFSRSSSGICLAKAVLHIAKILEEVLKLRQLALGGGNRHVDLVGAVHQRGVAHHRDLGAFLAGMLGKRVVQSFKIKIDLGHRPGERPGHDVVAMFDRMIEGDRRAGGDPDRHLFLHRLRHRGGFRELPELAIVLVIPGPERLHRRQHLMHVAPGVGLLEARMHAVEFTLIGARTDAEFQTSAGQKVGHRRLSGQPDRCPVGGNGDGGAQTDAVGMVAPPCQQLERVRGDGHLHRVMLGGPCDLEPRTVGHLDHFQRVAGDILHVEAVVDPLHVDGELEFHLALR